MKKTGAVIVAAGHKNRGTAFLPMLPVGDSTVIRRIIITMRRVGIDPIVVVTGKQGDELEKHISDLEVISLRNPDYETEQMFDSISMGLRYIRGLCTQTLILPAKFPLLLRDTLEKMLSEEGDIIRPVFDGKRGHPVLISEHAAGKVLEYTGNRGLRGALFEAEQCFVTKEVPVEDQGIIFAVETDEDSMEREMEKQKIQVHPEVRLVVRRNDPLLWAAACPFSHRGSSYRFHADGLQAAAHILYQRLEAFKGGGASAGLWPPCIPVRRNRGGIFLSYREGGRFSKTISVHGRRTAQRKRTAV